MSKAYIGIDPGKSGSICLLLPNDKIIFVDINEQPANLMDSIKNISHSHELKIMLEKVGPMQLGGLTSAWNFGCNVCTIRTVLACTRLGYDTVPPKTWQKEVGVVIPPKTPPAKKKKITEAVAIRLFPNAEIYGSKGGLIDGRSDALMIAHYCRIRYP